MINIQPLSSNRLVRVRLNVSYLTKILSGSMTINGAALPKDAKLERYSFDQNMAIGEYCLEAIYSHDSFNTVGLGCVIPLLNWIESYDLH